MRIWIIAGLFILPASLHAQRPALCDSTVLVDQKLAAELNVHKELPAWLVAKPYAELLFSRPELKNRLVVSKELVRNYPPNLRDRGIGGESLFAVMTDSVGRVAKQQLVRSSGYPEIDKAGGDVIKTMRFEPQRIEAGCAVPIMIRMPIVFQTFGR